MSDHLFDDFGLFVHVSWVEKTFCQGVCACRNHNVWWFGLFVHVSWVEKTLCRGVRVCNVQTDNQGHPNVH